MTSDINRVLEQFDRTAEARQYLADNTNLHIDRDAYLFHRAYAEGIRWATNVLAAEFGITRFEIGGSDE